MSKVKLVLDSKGMTEMLNSQGVQNVLDEHSRQICERANSIGHGQYIYDVQPGQKRAHGRVKTNNVVARVDNARRNILIKAMK